MCRINKNDRQELSVVLPLKQGLKLSVERKHIAGFNAFSGSSIKTRIETIIVIIRILTRDNHLSVVLPLKQGLKPTISEYFSAIAPLSVVLPLKQGLKPGYQELVS